MKRARRRWRRLGPRTLGYDSSKVTAVIFGSASPRQMWAFGVWGGYGFRVEGICFSLKSAYKEANKAIDNCEARPA